MTDNKELKETLERFSKDPDEFGVRESVIEAVAELSPRVENIGLYRRAFEVLNAITDNADHARALTQFLRKLPSTAPFLDLYVEVLGPVIAAVDAMTEVNERITTFINLDASIPHIPKILELRVHLWRLVLGLPERPHFKEPDMATIAKNLPKTVDYVYYRRYTLLGITAQLPEGAPFTPLFVEAVELAMKAAEDLVEPYYRMYALTFTGNMIAEKGNMQELHNMTIRRTYEAAKKIMDPLASELALIDLITTVPRKPPFIEILDEMLNAALSFFSLRAWMKDVDAYDVVDYVLSAEEVGMKETKQNRLVREKYAVDLGIAIEGLIGELKDTRFIETFKPYTHVWIKPKELRRSVQKVITYLEELKKTYHGTEILRPVTVLDQNLKGSAPAEGDELGVERGSVMAIDLGATNTVVMKKTGLARPEFIDMPAISKKYANLSIVPTLLGSGTNEIGTAVNDSAPITNIKQRLMEGSADGAANVERFYSILYDNIKSSTVSSGWFKLFSRPMSDVLYITVPVGFKDYSRAVEVIAAKIFKGVKVELVEEPLAAAIGYQVAEKSDKVVLLLDFGGCTLNSMVVRLNVKEVNVVAKPDMALVLGGNDIDVWLARFLAPKAGLPTDNLPHALLVEAESIKVKLSAGNTVPFTWNGREVCTVTRAEFEEVLEEQHFYRQVDRSVSYLIRRAEKVGLDKSRIEAVILTGGTSQIPSFKDKVGHLFPELLRTNRIYDHSPHTAVAEGAVLYGTRDVIDRHLSIAYGLRYATAEGKEALFSYSIVLEKGVKLPMERSLRITPAEKLGAQSSVSIELYELPDSMVTRRWVNENGIEFIKQEILSQGSNTSLRALKSFTLELGYEIVENELIILSIDELGNLSIKYGKEMGKVVETGIRLQ